MPRKAPSGAVGSAPPGTRNDPTGGRALGSKGQQRRRGRYRTQRAVATTFGAILAIPTFGISLFISNYLYPRLLGSKWKKRRRDGFRTPINSPTYSFDIVRTVTEPGRPIPVIYGTNKVGGNVVQAYNTGTATINQEQLYTLLALGFGQLNKIGSITSDSNNLNGNQISFLTINDNPSSDFSGIKLSLRMGTSTQAALPNTAESALVNTINQPVTTVTSQSGTTTNTNLRFLEFKIEFPNGLFALNKNGAFPLTCELAYTIQETTGGGGGPGPQIDSGSMIAVQENVATFSFITRSNDLTPGNNPLATPGYSGTYDWTVTRISDDVAADHPFGWKADSNLISVTEFGGDLQIYPHIALLEVAALATDQFNGDFPNFNITVEGKHVPIYSGSGSPVFGFSNNPAWCALDMLTNKVYGLGRVFDSYDKIDLDSFKDWADYCDSIVPGTSDKRFEFDHVFDQEQQNAYDAFLEICDMSRAIPVYSGQKLTIVLDKARDAYALITMGDIVSDSFNLSYQNKTDTPDGISLEFRNRDIDYETDFVEIMVPDPVNNSYNVEQVSRSGITKKTQATREVKFILLDRTRRIRTISFDTGPQGIGIIAGDRIEVAHDMPGWGVGSGRVLSDSGATNQFTIDRDNVVITSSSKVMIQHIETDVIETKDITSTPGTYNKGDTLTISGNFAVAPKQYSEYSIGDPPTKPFTVDRIEINKDLNCRIEATEYDEAIYSDDADPVDTITYTQLPKPGQAPLDVLNLTAVNRTQTKTDGTRYSGVDVYWEYPVQAASSGKPRAAFCEIYFKESTSNTWIFAGFVRFPAIKFSVIDPLIPGTQYDFAVVSTSATKNKKHPDSAPSVTILFTGDSTRPDQVTNFTAVYNDTDKRVDFTWSRLNDESNLRHYEIRRGDSWALGQHVASILDDDTATTKYCYDKDETYIIRAYNLANHYSSTASFDIAECERTGTALTTHDERVDSAWGGTKSNLTVTSDDRLQITTTLDTRVQEATYETTSITVPTYTGNLHVRLFLKVRQLKLLNNSWTDSTYNWTSTSALGNTWEGDLDNPVVLLDTNFATNGSAFPADKQNSRELVFTQAQAITSIKFKLHLSGYYLTDYNAQIEELIVVMTHQN